MPDDEASPVLSTVSERATEPFDRWAAELLAAEKQMIAETLRRLAIEVENSPHLGGLRIRIGRKGRRTLRIKLPMPE